MRLRDHALTILAALAFASQAGAQETLTDLLARPGADLSNPAFRADVVARMRVNDENRRQGVRDRATRAGLPLRTVHRNGRIQEITDFHPDGRPIYLTTHNANAAISTGANLLRTSPYTLSGTGIPVGVWDGGSVRSTHQEFGTRVTLRNPTVAIADHSTHVAGTIAASGVSASARGMASAATVESYDWNSDTLEMTDRAAANVDDVLLNNKIQLSNHSYGNVAGWAYIDGGTPYRLWQWYGTGTTSTAVDTDYGVYNNTAVDQDNVSYGAPYYLIFRSAGNDRGENPANGDSVYVGTSVVTYDSASHPPGDGNYRGGFETISYAALAKNVITVGSAADAVTSGLRDPAKASISSFSSWGPTDDGRIKPDVVANGDLLYSSLGSSDSAYGYYSGTSMASPNACGSAALLIQQFNQLFPGQAMRSGTLKGLLIHTADDLGNPGPDYKSGWGLVNVKTSADLILDHAGFPNKHRITENQISTTNTSRSVSFVWDGTSPIRATLCWTDPAGAATTSDNRTARLRNNLNLKVIAPNGAESLPFVMPFVGTWTQASMDSAATTGINNTDNVEQVRIANPPASGVYQVVVSFSGSLYNGIAQDYSLLLSGASDQLPPPPPPPSNIVATPGNNSASLTWTAAAGASSYNVKRSATSGGPYSLIASPSGTSQLDTAVSNGSTCYYVVSSVSNYGEGADSQEVSVIPAPVPSSTSVASSLGASGTYGTSVTFTATVSGSGGTPTGTVTFLDGATTIGTGTLNVSGQATCAVSNLTPGSHSITVSYSGDYVFGPGTSTVFAYTVTRKPVTITGVTAANKTYDATTAASLAGGTVSGVLSGETVTVIPGNGAFNSPDAGTQSVTASGYSIGGANVANYVLSAQPSVSSATILPLAVQLGGSRTYDGTATIPADHLSVLNNLDGAGLTLTGNATLSAKDAGVSQLVSSTTAARVQSATGNTGTGTAGSFTVILANPPVSGNTLVAVISARSGTSSSITSVVQTGAVWSRASQSVNSGNTIVEIWYASSVSNANSAITINQASLRSAAVVMEYSGVLSPSPLDRTAGATGSSTTPVTGTTATTNQANEVWIGGIGIVGSSPVLGSITNGFTTVAGAQSTRTQQTSTNAKVYALDRLVNPIAATSSGGTLSPSAPWAGTIATFRTVAPHSLVLTGPAAGNYTLTGMFGAVLTNPKALTIGSIAVADKGYDGGTVATLTGPPALQTTEAPGTGTTTDGKPYTGDTINVSGTATCSFDNRNAGIAKPVTVAGLAVGGTQAANYTLIQAIGLTANITPRAVTVTASEWTKTYDGTVGSFGTPIISPPLIVGDGMAYSQAFADANAGIGNKEIIPSITIFDGNSGNNYAVTPMNCLTGTINPAPAAITLGSLSHVYDGTAKNVTATTDPGNLGTSIAYDGSPSAPANAGSYTVSATIADPNYQASANGTLVIAKAAATVELTGLTHAYDGSPKQATVTTTPPGLAVAITYDGSSAAPSATGSYAVVAIITDPNHEGSASGTMIIDSDIDWTTWSQENFTETEINEGLGAENGDLDADGLANLAEYALGTDPRGFTPPLAVTKDVNGLTLIFTRPANLPDVIYAAESSDGLGTWTPVSLEVVETGEIETVRARDPLTGNPSRRFMRLHFERQ